MHDTTSQRSAQVNLPMRSSGIAHLDNVLHGGFEAGATWLIEGNAGAGKSLTITHFLADGVAQQEPCLLITANEPPAMILRSFHRHWPQLETATSRRLLSVLDPSPFFTEIRLAQETQNGNHTALWDEIWQFVQEVLRQSRNMGAKRVIIDSVTPLLLAYRTPFEIWDTAQMLVHSLSENQGATTLLTHLTLAEPHFEMIGSVLRSLALGVFTLEHTIANGYDGIAFRIAKHRYMPAYPFPVFCALNEHGHLMSLESTTQEHAA